MKKQTAIVKQTQQYKFAGHQLPQGTLVEIQSVSENGKYFFVQALPRVGRKSPIEYRLAKKDLEFPKRKFVVTLAWDTEGDLGESPVTIGVFAQDTQEALKIAVRKATNGSLYSILYTGEPKTPMVINVAASFACDVSKLTFINNLL